MFSAESYPRKGTIEVPNINPPPARPHRLRRGTVCSRPPAAHAADDTPIAINSPIQADGAVLEETVQPGPSAAGEASCSAPALFNPLTRVQGPARLLRGAVRDFEDPRCPAGS